MSQESIPFSKYSGAGNDFVIVEAEAACLEQPGALARRICPRSSGVGVDGLILLRHLGGERLRVRFFNPDGSEYATCGNGSRCAARRAADLGVVAGSSMRLVTDAGEVGACVEAAGVSLDYRMEVAVERELSVELAGKTRPAWLVQIGTPHLVLPLASTAELGAASRPLFEEWCRPVRAHPALGSEGANVNLAGALGDGRGLIRTFERGVEGETLACGSGAMATALVLHSIGTSGARLELLTRSGATLRVELMDPRQGRCGHIRLHGSARHLFDGIFPASSAGEP
ncbi:MAG: diaminopimelate epimerase [Gemmatimonadota bacterium]